MSVIPCGENKELRRMIAEFAEVLRNRAHELGDHGLDKDEFHNSGLFRGAIERIRGQFAASMAEKRAFAKAVLDHMRNSGAIAGWSSSGSSNRHDYSVTLNNGRTAAIELKGCLDGNNTNIFERPPNAHEFVIWSVCTNPGANPRHNVWSGIHARLSADIISREQRVDGLVVWDMACGTVARPCPKLAADHARATAVGAFRLPPPCLYVFPATVPSPRNNPRPQAQKLGDVGLLAAMHELFGGSASEVSYVDFAVSHRGAETVRKTRVTRGGEIQIESDETAIRRA